MFLERNRWKEEWKYKKKLKTNDKEKRKKGRRFLNVKDWNKNDSREEDL